MANWGTEGLRGGWICFIGLLLTGSFHAFGQEQADATDAQYEVGFHLGNLLPNQIAGVRDIMGLGGLRAGYRLQPATYAEAGLIFGNGEGAKWKNLHIGIRMDIPVEGLVSFVYAGGDMTQFKGEGRSEKTIFGGHAGGGLKAALGTTTWFRSDMKFSVSPGSALYFGFGLEFRF